jgi:hypothetical protein
MISADAIAAPDGETTADGIVPSVVSTGSHRVFQAISPSGNTVYTWSAFLKSGNQDWALMFISSAVGDEFAYIDTANCTTGTVGAGAIDTFTEDYGNGWCRAGFSYTTEAVPATDNAIVYTCEANADCVFAGDAASVSTYVWGMTFESAESPTSYVKTTTTSVTRDDDSIQWAADHYNAVTLQAKLMIQQVSNVPIGGRPFSYSNGAWDDGVYFEYRGIEDDLSCFVRNSFTQVGTGATSLLGGPDGTLQFVSCSARTDEHYGCTATACTASDTSVNYPASGINTVDLSTVATDDFVPTFFNYAKIYPRARVDGVPGAP